MDPAPYLTIQSLVDENRETMPTGLVAELMKECQKAHNSQPKLYELTWTVVNGNAQVHSEEDGDIAVVQLSHKTQTLIVEAVDERPHHVGPHQHIPMSTLEMPDHGLIFSSWIGLRTPWVIDDPTETYKTIIHSIVPYDPYKRARA